MPGRCKRFHDAVLARPGCSCRDASPTPAQPTSRAAALAPPTRRTPSLTRRRALAGGRRHPVPARGPARAAPPRRSRCLDDGSTRTAPWCCCWPTRTTVARPAAEPADLPRSWCATRTRSRFREAMELLAFGPVGTISRIAGPTRPSSPAWRWPRRTGPRRAQRLRAGLRRRPLPARVGPRAASRVTGRRRGVRQALAGPALRGCPRRGCVCFDAAAPWPFAGRRRSTSSSCHDAFYFLPSKAARRAPRCGARVAAAGCWSAMRTTPGRQPVRRQPR